MAESVVIIGAGWAGLAAAVKLTEQGHLVTVFESAKQAGGRARTVTFNELDVDNGQHILIGAYTECLALMKTVGLNTQDTLKRLPLLLTVKDIKDANELILQAPALPAPLHLLYALLTAKGLKLKDKVAAIKFSLYLKKHQYQFKKDVSVAELFSMTNQTEVIVRQFWEPLCLSTMNTPVEEASANVFMKVFKDAFTNKRTDGDLLLPTIDLSQLFPLAAVKYIEKQGGKVHLKSRVESVEVNNNQVNAITVKTNTNEHQTINISKLIIATAPQNLKNMIAQQEAFTTIYKQIEQYNYQPIVTVYLQYEKDIQLPQSMMGLSSSVSQWIFDRGSFCQQAGLMSIVISCNGTHMTMDDATLTKKVEDEISVLFNNKPRLLKSFVIREKRATFSCTVNINDIRPSNKTDIKGLFLAGDYTDTGYPATLEGAVRSGLEAAKLCL